MYFKNSNFMILSPCTIKNGTKHTNGIIKLEMVSDCVPRPIIKASPSKPALQKAGRAIYAAQRQSKQYHAKSDKLSAVRNVMLFSRATA